MDSWTDKVDFEITKHEGTKENGHPYETGYSTIIDGYGSGVFWVGKHKAQQQDAIKLFLLQAVNNNRERMQRIEKAAEKTRQYHRQKRNAKPL
jgi:hypothetical protein